jgi:benzylsuccinate CoA-transferase BbsF subunit
VKIVDLMWAVAGPTSARVLADLGATVVRIESSVRQDPARNYSPYVDGVAGVERSGLFNNQNAGKLGLTIDLARPEGRAVVADLAAWADVVMESFSAGSMASWGLGYEALSARNPSLIMLSSCLFGQTGPMSRFAGFGNLASALLGFHELTGWPDRAPVGPYGAYTDYVVPHSMASVVMAALDHRRRTGEGGHLDFAQGEAALHFLTPALLELQTTGVLPSRRGNDDPVARPHGVWASADDGAAGWVAVACETDAQRAALAIVVGEEPLEAWLAARPAAEAVEALVAAGVPAHRVQGPVEGSADPQLDACGHWAEGDHPVHGPMAVETTRFTLSRTPVGPRAAAPLLNQHVHDVLVGMVGYSEEQLAALDAAGVLR